MLPERTMAQRMQDDEDHRLALCGLSFDAAVEQELEDQASRHFDFVIFASGRRDPAPHDAKRAQDMWEGSGPPLRATQGSHHVLSPPPLSKT